MRKSAVMVGLASICAFYPLILKSIVISVIETIFSISTHIRFVPEPIIIPEFGFAGIVHTDRVPPKHKSPSHRSGHITD